MEQNEQVFFRPPAKRKQDETSSAPITKITRFTESLSDAILPNLPAKELVCLIVRSALETELGKSFTLNGGFDKMVKKIADSIMVDPILRRQALSIVSQVLGSKTDTEKKN